MNNFHPKQAKLFEKMKEDGALAHAFLFTGPEGVGKLSFARQIAMDLQGVENAEDHPDVVEAPVPLPIKEAKDLKKRLHTAPYSGKYKIVIIDQAEAMHADAANSLLKMIEEPKGNTIFFLISSYPQSLLDTILSRCYEVKFSLVPDDIIEKNINVDKIKHLRVHWQGRPRFAESLLNDMEYYRKIEEYKKDCDAFVKGSLKERFNITEKYAKIKKGLYQHNEMIRVWIEHIREQDISNKEELVKYLLELYKNITTTNANFYYLINSFAINTKKHD